MCPEKAPQRTLLHRNFFEPYAGVWSLSDDGREERTNRDVTGRLLDTASGLREVRVLQLLDRSASDPLEHDVDEMNFPRLVSPAVVVPDADDRPHVLELNDLVDDLVDRLR